MCVCLVKLSNIHVFIRVSIDAEMTVLLYLGFEGYNILGFEIYGVKLFGIKLRKIGIFIGMC